jgi:2-methylaconitate cis-trans-isomerase PrpF
MTGRLFTTGSRQHWLEVRSIEGTGPFTVRESLVDAWNPFIFVDGSPLPQMYHQLGPEAPESEELIESVRRVGAVLTGLAENVQKASLVRGMPKIAVLFQPRQRAKAVLFWEMS